jgi:hypothetical protein
VPLFVVSKYDLPQRWSIQGAGGAQNTFAKRLHDCGQARRTWFDYFSCDDISIDKNSAAFGEEIRNRCLATRDPTA